MRGLSSMCKESMLQHALCRVVKIAEHATGRSDFLAAVVDVTEFRNDRIANRVRHAPAGIVWKPVTVDGPDKVVSGDHVCTPRFRESASDTLPRFVRVTSTTLVRETASDGAVTWFDAASRA